MMSQRSPRERVLLVLLPAFLVLTVYGWFGARKPMSNLERTGKGLESARVNPISESDVRGVRAEAARLDRETETLLAQRAELEDELSRLVSAMRTDTGSTGAIEVLSGVLGRYGLRTVSEGELDPTRRAGIGERIKTLESTLADRGHRLDRRLWELELSGTYEAMLASLERLAVDAPAVIPVSIEMAETPEGGRLWKLVVWV